MFEKSFLQSVRPTNCDAHLTESLFQTCSNTIRKPEGDSYADHKRNCKSLQRICCHSFQYYQS
ncbi:DUF6783 domain-containing protein [Blautia sp. Sow4_E7]|uniref:DUF6783 domain-containing protein n=1 Tax=Blautia sp. Sow4_E7 TaxID=3438749 RepID=UPI003F935DBF